MRFRGLLVGCNRLVGSGGCFFSCAVAVSVSSFSPATMYVPRTGRPAVVSTLVCFFVRLEGVRLVFGGYFTLSFRFLEGRLNVSVFPPRVVAVVVFVVRFFLSSVCVHP